MINNDSIDIRHGDVFETAAAKWIGKSEVSGNESMPAPFIRKIVDLKKDIAKATLYITGLGQYEGFINGEHIDESIIFAPSASDYEKTIYYNVYDITSRLVVGENVFGFILGRGRYAFNTEGTPWNGETAEWIDQVKMIAVIELDYEDGTKDYCVTDESWQVRDSGILQDCMYMGETFDATVHDFDWFKIENKDGWDNCVMVESPRGELIYDYSEPIRITEKIAPIAMNKIGDKQFVFEFEKYITGWIELSADCPEGTEFSIQYTERKDENGVPYLEHSITPNGRLQKDFFVSSGRKMTYRPMFSYKGFRYVLVEGIDDIKLADVVGCFMHNDVRSVAEFECSNDVLNWLHESFRRTALCNFHGLSTDTPVFEKHGWGGDAAAVAPGVMLNFDVRKFYRKWAKDFLDSQTEEGEISVIVPTPGWGISGKTRWQAVCGPTPTIDVCWCEIVYRLYWCYEDVDALKENYDGLKNYTSYLKKWTDGGICQKGLGDWLAPSGDVSFEHAEPPEGAQVVESAYHIRIYERMEQIASVLGKHKDADEYALERQRLIKLFNEIYYDENKGYYHKEGNDVFRQAGNVVALAFGIPTEEIRENVLKNLLEDLRNKEWHFDMGMYTSLYLPTVLSESGYHDEAYRVVTAKGYPGFDYMRQTGASTIFEAWECDSCRSCCHYAFGATDYWTMTYLAGIHQLAPGFSKVKIDPKLPYDMEYVNYSVDTIRGVIEVECHKENGKLVKKVFAPTVIEVID